MMTIVYLVIAESKEAFKDNTALSEGFRHQHEEDLTAQIWNNSSINNCSGLMIRRCRELWCRLQMRFRSRVAVALA